MMTNDPMEILPLMSITNIALQEIFARKSNILWEKIKRTEFHPVGKPAAKRTRVLFSYEAWC